MLVSIRSHLEASRIQHWPSTVEHDEDYFAAVDDLSDAELTGFDVDSLEEVKVGSSAYGYVHIIEIPWYIIKF